mmetsp:Transcript_12160/g.30224  ORF Transcript_12160/g.30224 Transcript_12160/m.30224 type:complete len:83 (-) Transcript_12160:1686-1934(-)
MDTPVKSAYICFYTLAAHFTRLRKPAARRAESGECLGRLLFHTMASGMHVSYDVGRLTVWTCSGGVHSRAVAKRSGLYRQVM